MSITDYIKSLHNAIFDLSWLVFIILRCIHTHTYIHVRTYIAGLSIIIRTSDHT